MFNDIEDQPSDVLSGTSIAYKKKMLRRQSDRRILPKVQQKNMGVSARVYASEDDYYSEDLVISVQKTKSGLLPKTEFP